MGLKAICSPFAFLRWRICFMLSFTAFFSGCLGSDKPLFPSGDFTISTPIKPGHYLKMSDWVDDGVRRMGVEWIPYSVELHGNTYTLKEGGFSFYKKIDQHQQLFSPKGAWLMVGQSFDEQENIWTYRRVDFNDGIGFTVHRQSCAGWQSNISEDLLRRSLANGDMDSHSKGVCKFSDARKLLNVLMDLRGWENAGSDTFVKIDEGGLDAISKSIPTPAINPLCQGKPDQQFLGPGFGEAIEAPRNKTYLRVVSASERANATVEAALAVEAKGDKLGQWAWLTLWDEKDRKIQCGPSELIKITAFKPDNNTFSAQADPEKVQSTCAELRVSRCGQADTIITSLQRQGLKILLQGQSYFRFPDGKMLPSKRVTVMGNEGFSRRFVELVTEPNGATSIVDDKHD